MPANLPWEARRKLAEYASAREPEEKARILREAIALIPKHKGTAKVLRFLRRRLSELREQAEAKRLRRPSRSAEFYVERGNLPQVSILGPANAGKSSLLNLLTDASATVAPYPFTTTRPQPGVLRIGDASVQLVELPAVLTEDLSESGFAGRCASFARSSDALLIVLDASRDALGQLRRLEEVLEGYGLGLGAPRCRVQVTRLPAGGLRLLLGPGVGVDEGELRELLLSLGYRNALVRIEGEASLEEVEDQLVRGVAYRPAVIALNKVDLVRGGASPLPLPTRPGLEFCRVSAITGEGLDELRAKLFSSLGMIRVYTRRQGVEDPEPLLVRRGATIAHIAEALRIVSQGRPKFARLWRRAAAVQGQRVGLGHVLEDGDVVELYF